MVSNILPYKLKFNTQSSSLYLEKSLTIFSIIIFCSATTKYSDYWSKHDVTSFKILLLQLQLKIILVYKITKTKLNLILL